MITRAGMMRNVGDGKAAHSVRWYEARRIVLARQNGATVREIAARWRLTPETIRKILRRRSE